MVTASWDKTARLWDAATGKELARLAHEGIVRAAAFSPDGARIVTASDDTTARLWDAAGKELARLAYEGIVYAAAFSPDGARIVTASSDTTARLWDAATGEERALLAHEGMVNAAAFGPDGARIVTASGDKTARFWNAATGKELARLAHEDSVVAAALSPDVSGGRLRIVTLSKNVAFLWQVEASTDQLVQTAKKRLPRCLTQAQRAQYFLPKAPPIWCISGPGLEAEKDPARWQPRWPYQSAAWRNWLVARQRGESPPIPAGSSY